MGRTLTATSAVPVDIQSPEKASVVAPNPSASASPSASQVGGGVKVGNAAADPALANNLAPQQRPGAPTRVAATLSGNEATVTWVAPADDGGSPITGYTVTASNNGGSCKSPDAKTMSCKIGNLAKGTDYTFTATATNDQGTSDPSKASPQVTPVDPTPTPTPTPTQSSASPSPTDTPSASATSASPSPTAGKTLTANEQTFCAIWAYAANPGATLSGYTFTKKFSDGKAGDAKDVSVNLNLGTVPAVTGACDSGGSISFKNATVTYLGYVKISGANGEATSTALTINSGAALFEGWFPDGTAACALSDVDSQPSYTVVANDSIELLIDGTRKVYQVPAGTYLRTDLVTALGKAVGASIDAQVGGKTVQLCTTNKGGDAQLQVTGGSGHLMTALGFSKPSALGQGTGSQMPQVNGTLTFPLDPTAPVTGAIKGSTGLLPWVPPFKISGNALGDRVSFEVDFTDGNNGVQVATLTAKADIGVACEDSSQAGDAGKTVLPCPESFKNQNLDMSISVTGSMLPDGSVNGTLTFDNLWLLGFKTKQKNIPMSFTWTSSSGILFDSKGSITIPLCSELEWNFDSNSCQQASISQEAFLNINDPAVTFTFGKQGLGITFAAGLQYDPQRSVDHLCYTHFLQAFFPKAIQMPIAVSIEDMFTDRSIVKIDVGFSLFFWGKSRYTVSTDHAGSLKFEPGSGWSVEMNGTPDAGQPGPYTNVSATTVSVNIDGWGNANDGSGTKSYTPTTVNMDVSYSFTPTNEMGAKGQQAVFWLHGDVDITDDNPNVFFKVGEFLANEGQSLELLPGQEALNPLASSGDNVWISYFSDTPTDAVKNGFCKDKGVPGAMCEGEGLSLEGDWQVVAGDWTLQAKFEFLSGDETQHIESGIVVDAEFIDVDPHKNIFSVAGTYTADASQVHLLYSNTPVPVSMFGFSKEGQIPGITMWDGMGFLAKMSWDSGGDLSQDWLSPGSTNEIWGVFAKEASATDYSGGNDILVEITYDVGANDKCLLGSPTGTCLQSGTQVSLQLKNSWGKTNQWASSSTVTLSVQMQLSYVENSDVKDWTPPADAPCTSAAAQTHSDGRGAITLGAALTYHGKSPDVHGHPGAGAGVYGSMYADCWVGAFGTKGLIVDEVMLSLGGQDIAGGVAWTLGMYMGISMTDPLTTAIGADADVVTVTAAFALIMLPEGLSGCVAMSLGDESDVTNKTIVARPFKAISSSVADMFDVYMFSFVVAPTGCQIGTKSYNGFSFDLTASLIEKDGPLLSISLEWIVAGHSSQEIVDAELGSFAIGDFHFDGAVFKYHNTVGEVVDFGVYISGALHWGDFRFQLIFSLEEMVGIGLFSGTKAKVAARNAKGSIPVKATDDGLIFYGFADLELSGSDSGTMFDIIEIYGLEVQVLFSPPTGAYIAQAYLDMCIAKCAVSLYGIVDFNFQQGELYDFFGQVRVDVELPWPGHRVSHCTSGTETLGPGASATATPSSKPEPAPTMDCTPSGQSPSVSSVGKPQAGADAMSQRETYTPAEVNAPPAPTKSVVPKPAIPKARRGASVVPAAARASAKADNGLVGDQTINDCIDPEPGANTAWLYMEGCIQLGFQNGDWSSFGVQGVVKFMVDIAGDQMKLADAEVIFDKNVSEVKLDLGIPLPGLSQSVSMEGAVFYGDDEPLKAYTVTDACGNQATPTAGDWELQAQQGMQIAVYVQMGFRMGRVKAGKPGSNCSDGSEFYVQMNGGIGLIADLASVDLMGEYQYTKSGDNKWFLGATANVGFLGFNAVQLTLAAGNFVPDDVSHYLGDGMCTPQTDTFQGTGFLFCGDFFGFGFRGLADTDQGFQLCTENVWANGRCNPSPQVTQSLPPSAPVKSVAGQRSAAASPAATSAPSTGTSPPAGTATPPATAPTAVSGPRTKAAPATIGNLASALRGSRGAAASEPGSLAAMSNTVTAVSTGASQQLGNSGQNGQTVDFGGYMPSVGLQVYISTVKPHAGFRIYGALSIADFLKTDVGVSIFPNPNSGQSLLYSATARFRWMPPGLGDFAGGDAFALFTNCDDACLTEQPTTFEVAVLISLLKQRFLFAAAIGFNGDFEAEIAAPSSVGSSLDGYTDRKDFSKIFKAPPSMGSVKLPGLDLFFIDVYLDLNYILYLHIKSQNNNGHVSVTQGDVIVGGGMDLDLKINLIFWKDHWTLMSANFCAEYLSESGGFKGQVALHVIGLGTWKIGPDIAGCSPKQIDTGDGHST
ncbi:MAG: fibronectin type III domain-containing protein [Actinomycetes bacterium]